LDPYIVRHYQLEVANDVLNGMVHTLYCRPTVPRLVRRMAPYCWAIWHCSSAKQVVNRIGDAL
jgi:hypothetical protein